MAKRNDDLSHHFEEKSEKEYLEDSMSEEQPELPKLEPADIIRMVTEDLDADIFVYSGELHRDGADGFLDIVDRANSRPNVLLVLSTPGGDADAAYIIARYLKREYEKFILCVYGYCKSAGTLLALGADEIIMSDRGEFGPLDVQIAKDDEIGRRSSGLDIPQSLEALSDQAFVVFEKQFTEIKDRSYGVITTKTAGEIASSIAIGLLSPITSQIDPLKIGETRRAINIAFHYGVRLNGDYERVARLVSDYPSHSFVIDFEEASDLFENVREPNEIECVLEYILIDYFLSQASYNCVRFPHPRGVVVAYIDPDEEQNDGEPETNQQTESIDTKNEVEFNERSKNSKGDKVGHTNASADG